MSVDVHRGALNWRNLVVGDRLVCIDSELKFVEVDQQHVLAIRARGYSALLALKAKADKCEECSLGCPIGAAARAVAGG